MNKIILVTILGLLLFYGAGATIYTVNSNSDANTGATTIGTLRYCITQANVAAGKDTIRFALTGGGPYTLTVATNYPVINFPLCIQGFSQAGSVQGQLGTGTRSMQIILNGPGTSVVYGFQCTASNCEISGLVLQNFYKGIFLNGSSNSWIWGCYIGTASNGLTCSAATTCYDDGIALNANASNNFIGTNGDGSNDANEGNCIGGNGDGGTQYFGESIAVNESGTIGTNCTGNRIAGNYLGINEAGTAALLFVTIVNTQRGTGIHITNSTANIIGTNADGVSDALERNVISGNSDAGIVLQGSSNNKIKGNYVGTDKNGTAGVPNYSNAGTNLTTTQIVIKLSSLNNVVGTDGDGVLDNIEGNIIGSATITAGSANSYSDGIDIASLSTGNKVCGNYIGIGVGGTIAISILTTGIAVNDYAIYVAASNNTIGTNGDGVSDALEANYIGNSGSAVVLESVTGCIVAGNYFGLGANLTTSEPLGYAGVYITNSTSCRIGSSGSNSLERNYICNSSKYGIWVDNLATTHSDLLNIRFNTIGLRPDGVAASNSRNGILILGASNADTVQYNIVSRNGTGSSLGIYSAIQLGANYTSGESTLDVINNNSIYKNNGPGINIRNSNSIKNKLTQNSIYDNGNASDVTGKLRLGIDLDSNGVTLNDNVDPDTGPNGLANFPVITGATKVGSTCVQNVTGTYNGLANTQYVVELYSNIVCNGDTAGVNYYSSAGNNYGEGRTYQGVSAVFTTDASGNGAWTVPLTITNFIGQYLTAIAIQNNLAAVNSTSEFSMCYSIITDLGDAPDTYHTLLSNCGAAHLNANSTLKIGSTVDTETDGVPTINADGDGSDEDGISSFPTISVKSAAYSISGIPVTNTTGSSATLYAWIDLNRNGSFESTEFTSATVASGATSATLTWNLSAFTCAGTLVSGTSYMRMRLTTGTLTDDGTTAGVDERSYGIANDGEVEDYKIYICGVDYGDLNAGYPVATAICLEDTAVAKVWAGVNKPGIECTQKFSVDAYGDGSEEDGLVTSGGPAGSSYTWVVKLNSNQASKVVFYGLWIDWDANSNFTSALDGFYSGSIVTTGPTTASVSVFIPFGFSMSANFRLVASASAVTSGMYNATFTNSEVEDYSLITILSSPTNLLTASKRFNGNILQWNNDHGLGVNSYVIESSNNNISWTRIGTVISDGSTKEYSFLDAHPLYEKNYYRIKLVYHDNSSQYSNSVMLSDRNSLELRIFPDPAGDVINVQVSNSNYQSLEISDVTGKREIFKTLTELNNTIDISALVRGTHIIKLIAKNGNEEIRKFVKL